MNGKHKSAAKQRGQPVKFVEDEHLSTLSCTCSSKALYQMALVSAVVERSRGGRSRRRWVCLGGEQQ
eukprot:3879715-Pleurochrysis_carterae.AAC.1